jgi:hypothetical protein
MTAPIDSIGVRSYGFGVARFALLALLTFTALPG